MKEIEDSSGSEGARRREDTSRTKFRLRHGRVGSRADRRDRLGKANGAFSRRGSEIPHTALIELTNAHKRVRCRRNLLGLRGF